MTFTSVMPNLYSADVEQAVAFYRDLLGGTQTFRTPAEGTPVHVEVRFGDFTIAISAREEVPKQGLPAPAAGHPVELVLGCDSADDAVAALRAAGVPALVEPARHQAGHLRAYVSDPDGNWIAVVSK